MRSIRVRARARAIRERSDDDEFATLVYRSEQGREPADPGRVRQRGRASMPSPPGQLHGWPFPRSPAPQITVNPLSKDEQPSQGYPCILNPLVASQGPCILSRILTLRVDCAFFLLLQSLLLSRPLPAPFGSSIPSPAPFQFRPPPWIRPV